MKSVKRFSIFLLLFFSFFLTGCFPPFIQGAVEMDKYFYENVECASFTIDASAEGGFIENILPNLDLGNLTDSDETNIPLRQYSYYNFKTKSAAKDLTVTGLCFVILCSEETDITIQVFADSIEKAELSIELKTNIKQIISFQNFNITWSAEAAGNSFLSVVLKSKLNMHGRSYYMDSFILLGEE